VNASSRRFFVGALVCGEDGLWRMVYEEEVYGGSFIGMTGWLVGWAAPPPARAGHPHKLSSIHSINGRHTGWTAWTPCARQPVIPINHPPSTP
jgi:hypothetical protein